MTNPVKPTWTFPIAVLTKVDRQPNKRSIQVLVRELYSNTRAIHSDRGGGDNGHLAMVMTDAAYLTHADEAFDVPTHPGVQPAHALNATQA